MPLCDAAAATRLADFVVVSAGATLLAFWRTTSLTNLMCAVDLKSPSTLELSLLPALRSGGSRKDSFSRMTTARERPSTLAHPRNTISGKQQNKRRLKDRCSSSICRWPWSMRQQQQQQQLVSFGHWPLIVFTKQQHRLTFPSIRSAFLPSLKANHQPPASIAHIRFAQCTAVAAIYIFISHTATGKLRMVRKER